MRLRLGGYPENRIRCPAAATFQQRSAAKATGLNQTAHSLALCGVAVFPCNATKEPITATGFKDATTSLPELWTFPLTGVPTPPGIVIIDLDTEKGITAAAVDQFFGCSLDWNGAILQNTPSGGAHYAFRLPDGAVIHQRINWFKETIGKGFDTRAHGKGYICAGNGYTPSGIGLIKLAAVDHLPLLPQQVADKLAPPTQQAVDQQLPSNNRDVVEVVNMLGHVSADCGYEEWRNVGMALKHYFHDDEDVALSIFDDWSRTGAEKYDGPAVARLWSSIKPVSANGASITLGTLVTMARANGYIPPPAIDAADIFGASRVSCGNFDGLIERINAEVGQPGAIDRLTSEISRLTLSPMQRSEAAAVLSRTAKDHGLQIPAGDIRKACAPPQARAAAGPQPVPDTVSFIELPTPQIDGLDGNSGQSAGLIYDSLIKGRMGKFGAPYWWTGQRWEPVNPDLLTDMVSNAYGRGEYAKWSYISATSKTLASNLPRLRELGKPDRRIFFQNGVLDPVTGIMGIHEQGNNNTSVLVVDYNPSAVCPAWDKFVADIFEDEPERAYLLHEQLGWLICSHTLGIEKAMLFHGSSRAGKGVVIEVLYSIMGISMKPIKMAQLAKDKPLSAMRNAIIAVDSDATSLKGPDASIAHANFNAITANESVSVPLLFTQEPWHGPLNCKLLIACNEIPIIHDDSGATPRRWLPLLFSKSFIDHEDKGLKERLIAEREGIVVRIVEGLRRLISNGGVFTLPESTNEQMTALAHASSPVVEFISDCVDVQSGKRAHTSILYDAYRLWAVRTGNNILSRNKFTRSVKTATRSKGIQYVKSLRVNGTAGVATGFEGLALLPSDLAVDNVTPIDQARVPGWPGRHI